MNISELFPKKVDAFIKEAYQNQLRMILVGGGAVNFHGYRRHSADIDFWIETTPENLEKLLKVLRNLDYKIDELPDKVKSGEQNISINISPVFELELISNFNPGKTFDEAFTDADVVEKSDFSYKVLNFNDLILSKISSGRPKDKNDIEELQKIQILRDKKH